MEGCKVWHVTQAEIAKLRFCQNHNCCDISVQSDWVGRRHRPLVAVTLHLSITTDLLRTAVQLLCNFSLAH